MHLSKHFTLDEFTVSAISARSGIPNVPGDAQIRNLSDLCAHILEPLREAIGKPVVVISGFRSPDINLLARGSKTSEHMDGLAADIIVPGVLPIDVCRLIASLDLPFGQLIHEYAEWCHVSVSVGDAPPKREQLTAVLIPGSKTVYRRGLS